MKRFLVLLTLLGIFNSYLTAQPAQVLIIRHAEKDFEGNLDQIGQERAEALSIYFTSQPDLQKYGSPVSIFAARPTVNTFPFGTDENTGRCLQTISPTAQQLRLPIHAGYAKFQEEELARFILDYAPYRGKNILICWHADTIADLAAAFGIVPTPAPYPDDEFDETWVITFVPAPSLHIFHQRLLFGDRNLVP